MANEEILTSLRNAVARGESLENAKSVLINSGYNAKEVEESSQYVGQTAPNLSSQKPGEELAMPEKKSIIPNLFNKKPDSKEDLVKPLEKENISVKKTADNIKNEINETGLLSKELEKIGPKKPSHAKEIILLIVLLMLIGIFTLTIVFRDNILKLFP